MKRMQLKRFAHCFASSLPISVLLSLSMWLSFNAHSTLVYGSTLLNLVDVKGNNAIKEIRILYDINEEPTKIQNKNSPYELNRLVNDTNFSSTVYPGRHSFYQKLHDYQQIHRQFQLVRGRPLYAEVDFVPRYLPSGTVYVAISVELPAHIRGRKWILGWHQEHFVLPDCRLCTNQIQSYTLPVTLFLPDDGWCPEGRVPTIWKIEALPASAGLSSPSSSSSSSSMSLPSSSSHLYSGIHARMLRSMGVDVGTGGDQTDTILALAYDEKRQIRIVNHANSSVNCRGISEAIVA